MTMAAMALDVAVVMDPIDRIKVYKDTSFAMMLEARRRGHRLHYVLPGGLYLQDARPMARMAPVEVWDRSSDWFALGPAGDRPLAEMDVVLMRTDPPVAGNYLHGTQILSLAQAEAALLVIDPAGLSDLNETLGALPIHDGRPHTQVQRVPPQP